VKRKCIIATLRYCIAYLEITAINSNAPAQKLSVNKRWFDLDDDGLQASIAQQPILIATHAAHRARAAERGARLF